jgi:hypothetical protein
LREEEEEEAIIRKITATIGITSSGKRKETTTIPKQTASNFKHLQIRIKSRKK